MKRLSAVLPDVHMLIPGFLTSKPRLLSQPSVSVQHTPIDAEQEHTVAVIAAEKADHVSARRKSNSLIALALAGFLFLIARNSWLSDDAYVTFRTVDNFMYGYGLTWNVDERVQVYTHPLWMLLLSEYVRKADHPRSPPMATMPSYRTTSFFLNANVTYLSPDLYIKRVITERQAATGAYP
jgi:hypothetical protein